MNDLAIASLLLLFDKKTNPYIVSAYMHIRRTPVIAFMLRKKIFEKSKEYGGRRSVGSTNDEPNSNRDTCSGDDVKRNTLLTEEERREYYRLLEREKILDRQLSDAKAQDAETMNLLHKYNDIKDITQTILGALADVNGTTIKDLHEHYDLPIEDN